MSGRPGAHADGYTWHRGRFTNPDAQTLLDPNGHEVAHVYRGTDRTWSAVTADGRALAEHLPTSGAGLALVDNEVRPCVLCDESREPGSHFCTAHQLVAVWP